jgi:hypothetical protein
MGINFKPSGTMYLTPVTSSIFVNFGGIVFPFIQRIYNQSLRRIDTLPVSFGVRQKKGCGFYVEEFLPCIPSGHAHLSSVRDGYMI